MSILIFIIVLVVLIVVHEVGHFIVGKLSGMAVDEFGLGYPPRAATLGKIGETTYTLNWIPFGGFVKIRGEDLNESAEATPDPRAFTSRPRILQAIVLLAGVAMNLVLAWFIFAGILMTPHWVSDSEIARPLALVPALIKGAELTAQIAQETALGLGQFFVSIFTFTANLSQVTGPIGIAGAVGTASQAGWQSLLTLVALISINLAIINLIPIPALDGGRLLFVIIEAIIRRPLNAKIANAVNSVGFALLLLLMVVVSAHDVYKLFV